MRTLTDHLAQYGAYHRDGRNVVTHCIGVPLIVVAANALLARAVFEVDGHAISAAAVVDFAAALFYLSLDRFFGMLMAALLAVAYALGSAAAAQSNAVWLTVGAGGFVVGWVFQFVGHHFEGRKPAFADDLIGLAIGPLFIVAEAVFALGLRPDVARRVAGGSQR